MFQVVLIGSQGTEIISAETVVQWCRTINYEILEGFHRSWINRLLNFCEKIPAIIAWESNGFVQLENVPLLAVQNQRPVTHVVFYDGFLSIPHSRPCST